MIYNRLLLCLLGVSTFSVLPTAARVSIVGGKNAKMHEFPYQVALIIDGDDQCGGGIIDEFHILTAAHCVVIDHGQISNDPITIVAGTYDLKKFDKLTVKVKVKKVFVLREFTIENINSTGDIAVLKLKESLNFENHRHLKPLQLPEHVQHENYIGKTAKVAGYGWDWVKAYKISGIGLHRMGGNNHTHLRFIKADVVNDHECLESYTYKKIEFDKEFCARAKQHDHVNSYGVCTGDSGSPLVLDEKIVIGILSQGAPTCSEELRAGLYTRVSHYIDLIEHARHDRHRDDINTHTFDV